MRKSLSKLLRSLIQRAEGGPVSFISFDIEALPFRNPESPLDSLIWGKTPSGEYGIKRLCAILDEHRIKGNFMVDMAACQLYGTDAMREVMEYLLSSGHEVHAHLHPEELANIWGYQSLGIASTRFAEVGGVLNHSYLSYTFDRFVELTGKGPYLFRSGSYQFNRHTIEHACGLGFHAMSNYNQSRHGDIIKDEVALKMHPFRWKCGLAEIPVDISSPEKGAWKNFVSNFDKAMGKEPVKTCNVVLHSWSLLHRDEKGHHREHGPELEEQFHRICAHLRENSRVMGYREYLEANPILPEVDESKCLSVDPFAIHGARQCVKCRSIVAESVVPDGVCPACGTPGMKAWNDE
jgi:hypothetical protein